MSDSSPPAALAAGSAPRTAPAARPAVVLIGLVLLALAGLVGYELYAWLTGEPGILAPVLAGGLALEDFAPLAWVAGALLATGILLVLAGLRPTRASHLGFSGSLWLTPTAVARLCSARAREVAGVADATTTVGRRRVTVAVTVSTGSPEEINRAVRQAVAPVLSELDADRTLAVRVDIGAQR